MNRDAGVPLWILGIASVSIVIALGLPLPEARPPAPPVERRPASAPMPRPEGPLVDDFHRMILARFEDVRDGKFGVSRMGPIGPQHRRLFQPKPGLERLTLERLREAGWTTTLYVIEPRSSLLPVGGVRGPVDTGQPVEVRGHSDPELEALGARAMEGKLPVQGVIGGLPVEARPVLATSPACISCHGERKVGDPLGAVVYSFMPDGFAPLARH